MCASDAMVVRAGGGLALAHSRCYGGVAGGARPVVGTIMQRGRLAWWSGGGWQH